MKRTEQNRIVQVLMALLLVIMAFGMSACGEKSEDPYETYHKACDKMEAAKDMEFSVESEMITDSAENDEKTESKREVQVVKKSEDDMDMKITGAEGEDPDTIYYTGNVSYTYYRASDDTTAKEKTELGDNGTEEMLKTFNAKTLWELKLDENSVEKASLEEDGDNLICTFQIKPEKISEVLTEAVGNTMASLNMDTSLPFIKDGEMTITAVIDKDGYIKSQEIKSSLNIEMNEKSTITYNTLIEVESVDSGIQIEFPDLSEYI